MSKPFRAVAVAAFVCAASSAFAQTSAAPAPAAPAPVPAAAPNPPPNPADVASVDAIVTAMYETISGPVGKQRDWNRFDSLFLPNARMMPISVKEGTVNARWISLEEYRAHAEKPLMELGFYESEKAHTVEQFGELVHVFSTYEARKGSPTAEPFLRGVNSIQLVHDGKRWWVASIAWRAEDAQLKLPARYLQSR